MAVPTLSISAATDVLHRSVTGNAEILTGTSITSRGFELSTTGVTAERVFSEDGSFSTGTYSLSITDLLPGQVYSYRAFATNADGTGYSSWIDFTATAATYNVSIAGIDRTADIMNGSLTIQDILNDQQNTCSFDLMDLSGNGIPSGDQEIIITLNDGTKMFGGYLTEVSCSKNGGGLVIASISCIDYSRLFDSNLVHKSYLDSTDKTIIEAIVSTYCSGLGITTDNVVEGVTISQVSFNYVQPSQAMRRICDATNRNWYIDYDKDIHYFPLNQTSTPFNLTDSETRFFDINVSKDSASIKNRVYVRGGTYLSEFTTYSEVGDGAKTKFVLPDKPHEVTVTVNAVEKTVGIKNVNLDGFDFYLNFQEKYLEQDEAGTVLTASDTIEVTYKYDIPILVVLENGTSIAQHGTKEFAIFDKSITTLEAARDRAQAELTDYANQVVEATFTTYEAGFFTGQTINVNLTDYGINDDYIVTRVNATSYGAGNYIYTVSLASAKTMGIIRFLVELLEANKNLIELDDDEVVDELFLLTDSLLSDSLTDNLTIDSAGPYSTWCTDSLDGSPSTRAVWELLQWG